MIQYAHVDADQFTGFDEPGSAKTVHSVSVAALDDDHTFHRAVMRTAATDELARWWFRRYGTLGVGSGAHVLVHGLLEVIREGAETSREATSPPT